MSLEALPSHVAVLVPSVRRAADVFAALGFEIEAEEEWEAEGTREIYVGREWSNSLLLIEPIGPGPYQTALEKRGAGLHHLAIDVLDLESYVTSLAGSGWLLHPASIRTVVSTNTAYLARPGFPALIEVQGREELEQRELFVDGIEVPLESSLTRLLKPLPLQKVLVPAGPGSEPTLNLAGRPVRVGALL
jgi:hypothetical protein